ncbi:hypothetical protein DRO54_11990, partial [Candidatus Bathyarchaeota archaeon]
LPECHWVYYKIIAYDDAGNVQVKDNAGEYYVYHVIPEFLELPLLILALTASGTILMLITRRKLQRKTKN